MRRHRGALEAVHRDYFDRLEAELSRPINEVTRCDCEQHFVCVRRDNARGRTYMGCPLWRQNSHDGCRKFAWC